MRHRLAFSTIVVCGLAAASQAQTFSVITVAPTIVEPGDTLSVDVYASWTGIPSATDPPAFAAFGLSMHILEGASGVAGISPASISPALTYGSLPGTVVGADLDEVVGGQLANLFGILNPSISFDNPIYLFSYDVTTSLGFEGLISYQSATARPDVNPALAVYDAFACGFSIHSDDPGVTLLHDAVTTIVKDSTDPPPPPCTDCGGDIAPATSVLGNSGAMSPGPLAPLTTYPGDACPPSPSPDPYGTDPVYLFSGEFHLAHVDLSIPGRGIDLTWQRRYRSRVGPDTAQGNQWDYSYNIFIEQAGQDRVICDGIGRRDTYTPTGPDTWARDEVFRELREEPDGRYTLVFQNTGSWTFLPLDASPDAGRIEAITDRNGNTISFEYDGLGRLSTIRDTLDSPSSPRSLVVTYNPQGYIDAITDWTGRTIQYEYYDGIEAGGSAGDLKSVTTPSVTGTPTGNDFPAGKTTTYTYTTGFGDPALDGSLVSITDAKGQVYLTNFYAHTIASGDPRHTTDPTDGRVVRQVWGDPGDIIDIVYTSETPGVANGFASSSAIVNDRVGNVTQVFFDERNLVVLERELTGRWNPDQPSFAADLATPDVPALRAGDPTSFDRQYAYNDQSLVTRITHPNGNQDRFAYDELNPDPRARANVLEHRRLPGPLGGAQAQLIETFEYETGFGACCGTNFLTEHTDARGNVTTHSYDGNGNRLQTSHRIASIVEDYEYNTFGQLIKRVLPDNGGGCRRVDRYEYYDETDGPQNGYRRAAVIDATDPQACAGAHHDITTVFEYDSLGRMTRQIDPRGADTLYTYNALDQIVLVQSRETAPGSGVRYDTRVHYDANDNIVRFDTQNRDETGMIVASNPEFTTIYEYDILNAVTAMCRESGAYSGAIPGTPTLPTCVGLPQSEFVTTEYAYDDNRNRTLVRRGAATDGTDPFNTITTVYDERDLPFQTIRGAGSPDQSTDQYDYDPNANPIRLATGLEGVARVAMFINDGFDRRTATIDPMGNTQTIDYDANSNIIRTRLEGELADTPGQVLNICLDDVTVMYDAMDRPTRHEVMFVDTSMQSPLQGGQAVGKAIATFEWSDTSQPIRVVNDNLNETLLTYDTVNRLATRLDAAGNRVDTLYDANSNATTRTETDRSDLGAPDQVFVTLMTYDGLDRATSVTDNVGTTIESFYDSRDNTTRTIDGRGSETRTVYDGLSRQTAVIRDLNSDGANPAAVPGDGDPDIVTSTTWDASSRVIARTDDNANTTTYTYDPLDRLLTETFADQTGTSSLYDIHGNRTHAVDANGSILQTAYDLLDRPEAITISPGPGVASDTTSISLTYDGRSRLVRASDDDTAVTRSYDSLSNIIRESLDVTPPLDGADATLVACVYDALGNPTSTTYPSGRIIQRSFDPLERLASITDKTTGPIATYDWVGRTRVERCDLGNGTRIECTYDGITGVPSAPDDFGVRRLARATQSRISDGSIIDDRSYAWDRAGNKTRRTDMRSSGPELTHTYSYDPAHRLTRTIVTDPIGTLRDTAYELDGAGNRLVVSGAPTPGTYTRDDTLPGPADDQVNQYTATPFDDRVYDANGNLIRITPRCIADFAPPIGTLDFFDILEFLGAFEGEEPDTDLAPPFGSFDFFDILAFLSAFDAGCPTTEQLFEYDAFDRMVRHTDDAGIVTTYAYDALGRRIERTVDASGAPQVTRYAYIGWQVCEERDDAGALLRSYVYGQTIDDPVMVRTSVGDTYYHVDEINSVVAITDDAATLLERYEYDDYGRLLDPNTLLPTDPAAAPGNPYLFAGRRLDAETGFYYLRNRYLDPDTGRFTTRDPIGLWGDAANFGNGRTYVGANPWTVLDPFGLEGEDCNKCTKTEQLRRIAAKGILQRIEDGVTEGDKKLGNTLKNYLKGMPKATGGYMETDNAHQRAYKYLLKRMREFKRGSDLSTFLQKFENKLFKGKKIHRYDLKGRSDPESLRAMINNPNDPTQPNDPPGEPHHRYPVFSVQIKGQWYLLRTSKYGDDNPIKDSGITIWDPCTGKDINLKWIPKKGRKYEGRYEDDEGNPFHIKKTNGGFLYPRDDFR